MTEYEIEPAGLSRPRRPYARPMTEYENLCW